MLNKDYRALATDLRKEGILEPSNFYGALTVIFETIAFGGAFALLLCVEPLGPAFWTLQAFLGMSVYRWFVLLHEAGHRSLFKNRPLNTAVGLLASVFCFMPFYSWRHIHFLHHKWVGVVDKDPTQQELVELKSWGKGRNLVFRIVWFSWVPVMFLFFVVKRFWLQPIRNWKAGDKREALRGVLSLAVILVPRVVLFALVGWKWFLLYLGPMTYLYLFCNEHAAAAQHTGLFPFMSDTHPNPIPFHEQDSVSRTSAKPGLWSVFFGYHFNLHTEHHFFPSVPWYWLPRVTKRIEHLESYRLENFFEFTLRIRTTDPIKVYAKALPASIAPALESERDLGGEPETASP